MPYSCMLNPRPPFVEPYLSRHFLDNNATASTDLISSLIPWFFALLALQQRPPAHCCWEVCKELPGCILLGWARRLAMRQGGALELA
jgi:hypothetical protein